MAAIVTDQFRILNANNFVETVEDTANSYYVFLGLSDPGAGTYGRSADLATWNASATMPVPEDSFNILNHTGDTMIFGRKVTSDNIRRLIKKRTWAKGTRYNMYRHDYSSTNKASGSQATRLYDADYYVINKDYNVYICIDNGASGISTTGQASQDEPTFTGLEPSRAGESGDGYTWKYLFTVSPSDIVKFDSTDYIAVPNNWTTSDSTQIKAVRENGDASVNNNQIKKVYIDNQGNGYSDGLTQEVNILGDGSGGRVVLDVISSKITNAVVSSGGQGYSYGIVDLGRLNTNVNVGAGGTYAKLIPIIPPGKGHGSDLYKELGCDKVLIYARFDDSTKDFPMDAKFAQIGIVKNPTSTGSTSVFTQGQFSSLGAIKFVDTTTDIPVVGEKVSQTLPNGEKAHGIVASWDKDTKVMKYYQDRSLYFNQSTDDQTDHVGISTQARVQAFNNDTTGGATPANCETSSGFGAAIQTGFSGITTNPTGNKLISLGMDFTSGLASPEINKGSGEIIYLDNRSLISRNERQKEDVKIILEF